MSAGPPTLPPLPPTPGPPKGLVHSSFTVWSLMWTMPARSRWPIAMARPTLGLITAAERPPWLVLASATASSSVRKVTRFATGPKGSSSNERMPGLTPESTVGL